MAMSSSGGPNPYGSKGGPAHQGKVEEVERGMKERGLKTEREFKVDTPQGEKGSRRVDVVGKNPETGAVEEMHQVGRATKGGEPVARERRALHDIERATGTRPKFTPYNPEP
jgi:hypothetical protein